MLNLNKYIKIINESRVDSGTKYEKLIYDSLCFLQTKENVYIKNNIENEISQLEKRIKSKSRDATLLNDLNSFFKSNKISSNFRDINLAKDNLEKNKEVIIKKFLNNKIKIDFKAASKDKLIDAYLDSNTISDEYKALRIANQLVKSIIKSSSISSVNIEHLGDKKYGVSQYWKRMSSEVSEYLNQKVTSENPISRFLSKVRSESKSKSKTDIIINEHRLSLKLKENTTTPTQLATPTIVDVYTLIFHGIRKFIEEKNAALASKFKQDENLIKNNIGELINYLDIKNIKTSEYVTIVYVSLIIDIILKNNKSVADFDQIGIKTILKPKNTSFKFKISKLRDIYFNQIEPKQLETIKEYLTIKANKNISKTEKQKLDNLKKSIDIILLSLNNKQNDLYTYVNQINDFFSDETIHKQIMTSIKKSTLSLSLNSDKDKIKNLISVLKGVDNKFKRVDFVSDIDEKVINFFNNKDKKQLEYEKVFLSRKDQKRANAIFDNEAFKIIKKYQNIQDFFNSKESLNKIKEEIIKEAVQGTYKFSENGDSSLPNIPTHIFEFDLEGKSIELQKISDGKYIEKTLASVKFNFSFKGGSKKSYIVLRLQDSFQNSSNDNLEVYNEFFFDKAVNYIYNIVDDVKIKFTKMIMSRKAKIMKLLKFLGFRLIIKKAQMPKWIVDKL
jgi:hypothetical protein